MNMGPVEFKNKMQKKKKKTYHNPYTQEVQITVPWVTFILAFPNLEQLTILMWIYVYTR